MRNYILRHPNAVRSKNVAAKRCTVVHKAHYVFLLDVVRINHFRVHNLQKSRDLFIHITKFTSITKFLYTTEGWFVKFYGLGLVVTRKVPVQRLNRGHVPQMKKMMIPTVLSVQILSQIASPLNSGYNVSNARNGPMKSVWKLGLHTFVTIVTVMTQIFSIRSSNVCTFVFINSSYHGFEFLARLNN